MLKININEDGIQLTKEEIDEAIEQTTIHIKQCKRLIILSAILIVFTLAIAIKQFSHSYDHIIYTLFGIGSIIAFILNSINFFKFSNDLNKLKFQLYLFKQVKIKKNF